MQIVRLLMYFGDLMQNIEINFAGMTEVEGQTVLKTVNEQSFESLRQLSLFNCKGSVLNVLKHIFSEVKIMKISTCGDVPLKIDEEVNFNEFFPRITHLEIRQIYEPDWIIMNATFLHLKWVKISMPGMRHLKYYDLHLINFFRYNKQIDGLAIISPNHEILQAAEETLPYLNTIELLLLHNLMHGDHEINFNTVKRLNIETSKFDKDIDVNIKFNQLEILTMVVEKEFTIRWIRFMQNQVNSKLSSLTLTVKNQTKDYLLIISDIFPYLESFKFDCKSTFAASDIAQFIKKSQYLKHIELYIEIDENDGNNLQNLLTKNWILELNTNSTLANVKGYENTM